jgi:tRNA (guanine-N7-)-methyltransferase
MIEENIPLKRTIRSFVLRTGRKTPSQERAYTELWPKLGISISDGMLDFEQVFGRKSDVVLEIGFGMGDSLVEMAMMSPEQDFIGIEVHTPGVGRIMNLIEENKLSNIKVYAEDAVQVLNQCIPGQSLSKVQIFFPDPWHKKKHNKRRIVQPIFIQEIRKKLKQGGLIHLATDWENYAEHMLEVMSCAEGFSNTQENQGFSPKPAFRPETKFERRGQRLGHGVWDLLFKKQS